MKNETLITIEKYAAMKRESIHKVIKKTMRGELKTVVEEKDGRTITYIVMSGDAPAMPAPAAQSPSKAEPQEAIDYKAAYEALQKELQALKEKSDKGE